MRQMNPLTQQTAQLNGISNNAMASQMPKVDLTQKPDTFELSANANTVDADNTEQKPKKSSGLKTAAILLGITAAAAGIIYAIKKGKTKKLADIDFNKGFASLKGSEEGFTGVIKDTLKNGDKIKIEYKNGIRQNSTRKGAVNIKKIFKSAENGDNLVTKIVDGVETTVNTTQKAQEALAAHPPKAATGNRLDELLL